MELYEVQEIDVDTMRSLMLVTQNYVECLNESLELPRRDEPSVLMEEVMVSNVPHPIIHDLGEVVTRLRAYLETAGGEYAMGVETGMSRAAEMIENLIKRHEGQ